MPDDGDYTSDTGDTTTVADPKKSWLQALGVSWSDSSSSDSSSQSTSSDDNGQSSDTSTAGPSDDSSGGGQSPDPNADVQPVSANGNQSVQPNSCDPPDPNQGIDPSSDSYQQGYEDGVNGADAKPPGVPASPEAMDNYNAGYAKGHALWMQNSREEPEENLGGEVLEHVIIHGVVHAVEHLLKIGGGIYTFLVAMTVGMECDTRMYMFKCPTCGATGEPQCTQDEAQADADNHKKVYPDHLPDVSGPGMSEPGTQQ